MRVLVDAVRRVRVRVRCGGCAMSGREWKPGDVAMVTAETFHGPRRTERAWLGSDDCWRFSDGSAFHVTRADLVKDVRPLVVIDPENREQVERLMIMVRDGAFVSGDSYPGMKRFADAMQTALRSLITDPKPEEPTGLGAVIREVGSGAVWTSIAAFGGIDRWSCPNGDRRDWARIPADVRVLSEGVAA